MLASKSSIYMFVAAITIITDPCPTRVPLWPLTDYARNTGKPWKPFKSLDLVQDPTHLQLAGSAQQVIQTQFKPITQIVLTSWRHPWDTNATTFPKILTMSTRSGPSPTTNTSAVRNTVGRGKEKSQENPNEPASDASLREFCDKNYNQLLPILAEKMHQEKVQQEKLKAVKARLNFEKTSQYSESGAPSRRRDVGKKLRPKDAHSMSRSPEPRRNRSRSPRRKYPERETVFRRLEKGVFHRLGDKEKGMSAYSDSSRRQSHHSSRGDTESYYQSSRSRGTEPAPKRHHDRKAYSRKGGRMSESEDSAGGHWKSKSKKQRSSMEDEDLSQP
ncbi:hypothetical protein Tco_0664993 [Tanacetum coccineum]